MAERVLDGIARRAREGGGDAGGLAHQLLELWRGRKLCDVELRTASDPDAAVPAHAVVLAASSKYCMAVLAGPWSEASASGGQRSLEVPVDDAGLLEQAVAAIYGATAGLSACLRGPDGLDVDRTEQLLELMSYLDVSAECQRRLSEAVLDAWWGSNTGTLRLWRHVELLLVAIRTNLGPLQADLEQLAGASLEALLTADAQPVSRLGSLPLDSLARVAALQQRGITFAPLSQRLTDAKALVCWLAHDMPGRAASARQALEALQLQPGPLLAQQLQRLAQEEYGSEAATAAALAACEELSRLCHTSFGAPASGQAASLGGLVVCGGRGHDWTPVRTVEHLSPGADRWQLSPAPPVPGSATFVCGAGLPGGALVLPGSPTAAAASLYAACERAWRPAGCLAHARLHAAAACMGDTVFVTGGKSGRSLPNVSAALELCAPVAAEPRWLPGAPLLQPRACHGAAALGGRLFVAGGQSDTRLFASVEAYDPGADVWTELAPSLRRARKYFALASHEGRLFAVGGMDRSRARLASVEAWDPRDPAGWAELPPLPVARSSCSLAVLGGRLFAIGGTDAADEPLPRVDTFAPAAAAWLPAAPLLAARTGHLAAAC